MSLNRLPARREPRTLLGFTARTRILLLLFLLVAEGGILSAMMMDRAQFTAGLILPKNPVNPRWAYLDPWEVESGATIQADTNVTFHLPEDMPTIRRETLLGGRGWRIRYWGYCFQNEDDPNSPPQDTGFPGRMFLSELERYIRLQNSTVPIYPITAPPTKEEIERDIQAATTHGLIRHQVEDFTGGQNCYIMSNAPLPIGTDRDGDGLNTQLEIQYKTSSDMPDTDQDGAFDGVEVLNLHTDPVNPDSDGDGIPDGIEVHGHTKVMPGDTDPLIMDSDHDGLCDGLCMVDRNRQYCTPENVPRCTGFAKRWAGEDKNLNGEVDDDETDPLKSDSDDDGILDIQEYYNCLLDGGSDC